MQDVEYILKTRIKNEKANTFVVVVPTNSARLKRQRELVSYHQNKAVANLRVYTLETFIQRLYEQVDPARRSISQGLQNLWMHEIANPESENSCPHPYEAFRPSKDVAVPDSTLSLIIGTINRLRERGESTQSIVADNPTKTDLVRIYEKYETKLAERWIDEQGKHLHLAHNFNPQFMGAAFPQVNLVVVEGFAVLSKAAIKILTRIAKIPTLQMWFRTDWMQENENLYKNVTDLVQQFRAVHASIDTAYERDTEQHQHFAENLFRTANANHNSDGHSSLKVLRPVDRSEEVEEIARRIQEHVSKKHCNFNDICVAYYNVGLYQQRISEIFPAYGIPYSLVGGIPLTKSEVVKAIFSHLSSDRTPLSDTYFSQVEPASETHQFHPSKFQEYVENLLKKGEVIQHILNPMLRKNREVIEAEVEAYRQFNRIVKELCSVLMSEDAGSDSLGNYVQKLHHIAKHTPYQNRASTKGETVRIVQLGDLRSQEFDTVFLGDLVDGRFPENYRPDPLLPEIPYRTEAEQLHDNRFMFYRVLKSFRQRLYLLVPQREGEADLIPSPFLEQLKAVADVEEIEIADRVQGSIPAFLSGYGNHVWTAGVPSDGEFPEGLEGMRPLIKHVVAVEKSRENEHDLLDHEGVLTIESLSPENWNHLKSLKKNPYSVTELETYGKCPFQYFAGKVLNVHIEDDAVEDELSSLEKGSLLHKVLFTFYSRRREQNDPPLGQCAENDFKEAKGQLNEILKSLAEKEKHNARRAETPIGENNLFWETDIEKLRVALHKWIEAERAYDLPVLPRYFEVNVGQSGEFSDLRLSRRDPIYIGTVRIKGKIDRIDVDNSTFNVIDYKTGSSTIRMPEILNGRSLQLPIYLQIAEKLLERHNKTGLEPAAGLYHKVRLDECAVELGIGQESLNGTAFAGYKAEKWKKVNARNGQLIADQTFEARLVRTRGYVQQYVDNISNGNFPLITRVETFVDSEEEGDTPLTPRNKTEPCNYCAYKRTCRVGAISESSQSDD